MSDFPADQIERRFHFSFEDDGTASITTADHDASPFDPSLPDARFMIAWLQARVDAGTDPRPCSHPRWEPFVKAERPRPFGHTERCASCGTSRHVPPAEGEYEAWLKETS